jgi:hypothetical protein
MYHALPKGILDLLMINKCHCVATPPNFEQVTQFGIDIEPVHYVEPYFKLYQKMKSNLGLRREVEKQRGFIRCLNSGPLSMGTRDTPFLDFEMNEIL